MAEECSSGGFSELVGLLRVVKALERLRDLTLAFGDHESQVGGGMNSAEILLDTLPHCGPAGTTSPK